MPKKIDPKVKEQLVPAQPRAGGATVAGEDRMVLVQLVRACSEGHHGTQSVVAHRSDQGDGDHTGQL